MPQIEPLIQVEPARDRVKGWSKKDSQMKHEKRVTLQIVRDRFVETQARNSETLSLEANGLTIEEAYQIGRVTRNQSENLDKGIRFIETLLELGV